MEKDYKHIDRLYQEKFKDFDPKPDTSNWEQIAARIDNKKRRRIIPIWWRFGGVAAVLALVLYLFIPKNVVVQAPSETQISDVVPQQKNLENKPIHNKQAVVETTTDSKEYNIGTTKPSGLVPKNSVSDNTGIVARNSKKPEPKYKKVAPPTAKEEASVAQTEKVVIRPTNPQEENVLNKTTKKQETIAQNALEEAINKLEEEAETEVVAAPKAKSKWSVIPNIAPVYYNNFGTGSPVSEEFVQNDKSGQFQMSYGIHVAYDMGKKWALRTGLNNVNLSYATNGVQFTTAAASAEAVNQEMNINFLETANNIVVFNEGSATARSITQSKATKGDFSAAKSPIFEGEMIQQITYIEVPLEVAYQVLDKRVGMQIHGGFSSLFLTDNNMYLQSNNLRTELGEANSLNSFNFSTNIGFGVHYKISDQLMINVEPTFKYQWNTYSSSFGSMNPYAIGVYSGLRLKF